MYEAGCNSWNILSTVDGQTLMTWILNKKVFQSKPKHWRHGFETRKPFSRRPTAHSPPSHDAMRPRGVCIPLCKGAGVGRGLLSHYAIRTGRGICHDAMGLEGMGPYPMMQCDSGRPVNRKTDTTENDTFPQTTYASDDDSILRKSWVICVEFPSKA